MSFYSGPQEHAANPPSTWRVVKRADRVWSVVDKAGTIIDSVPTKHAAEQLRTESWLTAAYAQEERWYRGESVSGWKIYEPPAGAVRVRFDPIGDDRGNAVTLTDDPIEYDLTRALYDERYPYDLYFTTPKENTP